MTWQGLCYVDENLQIINEVNGRPIDTLNLDSVYVTNGAQRWSLVLPLEPVFVGESIAGSIANILGADYGQRLSVPMPQIVDVSTLGSHTVSGAARARNVTTSVDLPLLKGRFIKFSSHSKVYIVMSKVGRNVEIYPRLQQRITRDQIDASPDLRCRQRTETISVSIQRKILRPLLRVVEVR